MSFFYVVIGIRVDLDFYIESIKCLKSFYSEEEAFKYAKDNHDEPNHSSFDFVKVVKIEMPFSPPA